MNTFISDNDIKGGMMGVVITDASPRLDGNSVDVELTGVLIGGLTSTPVLTDNTICGDKNGVLPVADASMPDLASNDICPIES